MSYDIQICRKEAAQTADFWEQVEQSQAVLNFSGEQKAQLHRRLLSYGYRPSGRYKEFQRYEKPNYPNISAMLTDNVLYLSASYANDEGAGIFEISMDSSEIADGAEFVKYDPQNQGWE